LYLYRDLPSVRSHPQAQLEDQEGLNAKQTPVLELQAKELQESIEERRRDREEKERWQAIQVAAWMLVEQEDERGRYEVDLDDFRHLTVPACA
jgi:myo-inositol-1-phosphate synthase